MLENIIEYFFEQVNLILDNFIALNYCHILSLYVDDLKEMKSFATLNLFDL